MELASIALVERRYFEAERLALTALRRAHASRDYERLARIVMPLQEARRQKRDLAFDAATKANVVPSAKRVRGAGSDSTSSGPAGGVAVVSGEVPSGKALVPGCYLIAPPRVGLDGRLLRETADKREIPVIITVREPESRDGLWPLVALGPVTIRTKVAPPCALGQQVGAASSASGVPSSGIRRTTKSSTTESRASLAAKSKSREPVHSRGGKQVAGTKAAQGGLEVPANTDPNRPTPEWFLAANEALGDAAIASIPETMAPHARVDALMERLEAMPDHEKLHQRLAEAARDAYRTPMKAAQMKKRPASAIDDEDEDPEE